MQSLAPVNSASAQMLMSWNYSFLIVFCIKLSVVVLKLMQYSLNKISRNTNPTNFTTKV